MKYCLLVLGCFSPQVLSKIGSLFNEYCPVFVHLDAKVSLPSYIEKMSGIGSNVRFIDERYSVYWGGFNMIRASMALVGEAMKCTDADCLILISDDSIPLFSPEKISRKINEASNRIFSYEVKSDTVFSRRYSDYYFMDSRFSTPRWLPAEQRSFDFQDCGAFERLKSLKDKGKFPLTSVRTGSQWWSLHRDVLEEISSAYNENIWLRESFEFSAIPDESFFQTLAYQYFLKKEHKNHRPHGIMHVDFSKDPKPYVYSSISELLEISDDFLFIRKVNHQKLSNISDEIKSRSQYDD